MNMSEIIKAMKLLSSKRNDFILEIIREGKDKKRLVDLASELKILNKLKKTIAERLQN